MAHSLRFTPVGSGGDPRSLVRIVESFVNYRNRSEFAKLDVMDVVSMSLRPEEHLERLADYAIALGNDSFLYDIGKFGMYDCEDCGADDIEYGSYDDDCDEE